MSYYHVDSSRESEPHALPDVEVFHHDGANTIAFSDNPAVLSHYGMTTGYYYAYGFPGCLWDGEPVGPFETEAEALKAARNDAGMED